MVNEFGRRLMDRRPAVGLHRAPLVYGLAEDVEMRPNVSRPTGIVIGPPVAATWVPHTSPSVVSIATVVGCRWTNLQDESHSAYQPCALAAG